MTTRRTAGLTLIEVLIALMVLAIGVVAAAQLQAASLRFSGNAADLKVATEVAKSELEWRRQTALTVGADQACASNLPDGYSCAVTVLPCNAVGSDFSLTCAEGLVSPVAYQISVTAAGNRTAPFTLSAVTTGKYIGGVVGDGTIADADGSGGGSDPGTGGTDPGTGGTDPGAGGTDPGSGGTDPGTGGGSTDPRPCIKFNPNGKCTKYG